MATVQSDDIPAPVARYPWCGTTSTRAIEMQQQVTVRRAARRAALKDQERRVRASLENGKLCRR